MTAPRFPPVASHALSIGGVVQGIAYMQTPAKPIFVMKYANDPVTSGVIINGTTSNGFNTIGKPNVIGSLISNTAGAASSFAIAR